MHNTLPYLLNEETSVSRKHHADYSDKSNWAPIRGLPFNIQGGGGRDIGMDQNIFFNMIQLMVIFSQLYG